MVDIKFKLFEGKICKVFLKDGFFRQGKILEIDSNGIVLDDRKDGITFVNFEIIKTITEFRDDKRK